MKFMHWDAPWGKWVVLAFVLVFLAGVVRQCRAAEVAVMGGVATGSDVNVFNGNNNAGVGEIAITTDNRHWELALGFIGNQYTHKSYETVANYSYLTGLYVATLPLGNVTPFIGLGASWRSNSRHVDELLPSALNFSLAMGVDLFEHWRIEARHFSNSGTREPNRGQNMLLAGYRF